MLPALLLELLLSRCAAEELPPNLEAVKRVGCEIAQITEPRDDAFYGWWRFYSWAESADGTRWRRLHSVRDKRARAMRDCDEWLECVRQTRR